MLKRRAERKGEQSVPKRPTFSMEWAGSGFISAKVANGRNVSHLPSYFAFSKKYESFRFVVAMNSFVFSGIDNLLIKNRISCTFHIPESRNDDKAGYFEWERKEMRGEKKENRGIDREDRRDRATN